jgi:uncharacterized protein YkwD
MESEVFGLINGERSTALIEHSGLLSVARAHSQYMAISGGINHDNADERISNAPPDPPEANGAPDDGFGRAAWCENVTSSTGFPASEVGRRLFEQWHRSAPHQACMTNPGKNVAAVGIYYDGSTWWATFIAEVDHTPPGGSAAPPPPRPTAQPAPPAAQPADHTAPAAAGQPAHTTPTQSLETHATAGSSESVSESSVTTANSNAAMNAPISMRPVAPTSPSTSGFVRRYEIAVEPFAKFATSLRARRGEVDVPIPAEIAVLAGLALMVFRRSEKRLPTWLTANRRFAARPDRPPHVVRVASPS